MWFEPAEDAFYYDAELDKAVPVEDFDYFHNAY